MLSNIVHQPKIWYKNIEELAESETNFDIYIPKDTLTFHLLLERSKGENEDSKYWKKLLEKVKFESYLGMQSFHKLNELCTGKGALIFNSLKGKRLEPFKSECDLSLNELKYDGMNVIRLIRKDYEYSDQMIKM
jgi:pimeloyl-CoA synthetase